MIETAVKTIVISLVITPIIYLGIAFTLVLLPVERNSPEQTLDFDVLDVSYDEQSAMEVYFDPLQPKALTNAEGDRPLFYRQVVGDEKLVFVLIHGSGSEGRYLLPLANQLNVALGASVIIPDLRGHGESSFNKRGDIDYMDQYLDDLAALSIRLRQQFPDAKIILGGHSSGGGLAVKYGGHQASGFDGYVLLAPYLGYQAPTVREDSGGWVQVSTRRYIGLSMLNNVAITSLNHTSVLFFNRPAQVDNGLQVDSYSYQLNQSYSPASYVDELEANSQPILLLVGENDEAFYADKFVSAVVPHASQAKVRVLPNLKHLDLPASNAVVDEISLWLKKELEQ